MEPTVVENSGESSLEMSPSKRKKWSSSAGTEKGQTNPKLIRENNTNNSIGDKYSSASSPRRVTGTRTSSSSSTKPEGNERSSSARFYDSSSRTGGNFRDVSDGDGGGGDSINKDAVDENAQYPQKQKAGELRDTSGSLQGRGLLATDVGETSASGEPGGVTEGKIGVKGNKKMGDSKDGGEVGQGDVFCVLVARG